MIFSSTSRPQMKVRLQLHKRDIGPCTRVVASSDILRLSNNMELLGFNGDLSSRISAWCCYKTVDVHSFPLTFSAPVSVSLSTPRPRHRHLGETSNMQRPATLTASAMAIGHAAGWQAK